MVLHFIKAMANNASLTIGLFKGMVPHFSKIMAKPRIFLSLINKVVLQTEVIFKGIVLD